MASESFASKTGDHRGTTDNTREAASLDDHTRASFVLELLSDLDNKLNASRSLSRTFSSSYSKGDTPRLLEVISARTNTDATQRATSARQENKAPKNLDVESSARASKSTLERNSDKRLDTLPTAGHVTRNVHRQVVGKSSLASAVESPSSIRRTSTMSSVASGPKLESHLQYKQSVDAVQDTMNQSTDSDPLLFLSPLSHSRRSGRGSEAFKKSRGGTAMGNPSDPSLKDLKSDLCKHRDALSIDDAVPPLLHCLGQRITAMRTPWRLQMKEKSLRNNVTQLVGFFKMFERFAKSHVRKRPGTEVPSLDYFYKNVYLKAPTLFQEVEKVLDKRQHVNIGKFAFNLGNFGCEEFPLLFQKFAVFDLCMEGVRIATDHTEVFNRQILEFQMNSRGVPTLSYLVSVASAVQFWLEFYNFDNLVLFNYNALNYNILLTFACTLLATYPSMLATDVDKIIISSFDWRNNCFQPDADSLPIRGTVGAQSDANGKKRSSDLPVILPISMWAPSYKRYLSYFISLNSCGTDSIPVPSYRLRNIYLVNCLLPGADVSMEVYTIDSNDAALLMGGEQLLKQENQHPRKRCSRYTSVFFKNCLCGARQHSNQASLVSCPEDYRILPTGGFGGKERSPPSVLGDYLGDVVLDFSVGSDGEARNVTVSGDVLICFILSTRRHRRVIATFSFNTAFLAGDVIEVPKFEMDIWDPSYVLHNTSQFTIVLEPCVKSHELSSPLLDAPLVMMPTPKPDVRIFMDAHIAKIDPTEVYSLMSITNLEFDTCLFALKICQRYMDAVGLLNRLFAQPGGVLTEELVQAEFAEKPQVVFRRFDSLADAGGVFGDDEGSGDVQGSVGAASGGAEGVVGSVEVVAVADDSQEGTPMTLAAKYIQSTVESLGASANVLLNKAPVVAAKLQELDKRAEDLAQERRIFEELKQAQEKQMAEERRKHQEALEEAKRQLQEEKQRLEEQKKLMATATAVTVAAEVEVPSLPIAKDPQEATVKEATALFKAIESAPSSGRVAPLVSKAKAPPAPRKATRGGSASGSGTSGGTSSSASSGSSSDSSEGEGDGQDGKFKKKREKSPAKGEIKAPPEPEKTEPKKAPPEATEPKKTPPEPTEPKKAPPEPTEAADGKKPPPLKFTKKSLFVTTKKAPPPPCKKKAPPVPGGKLPTMLRKPPPLGVKLHWKPLGISSIAGTIFEKLVLPEDNDGAYMDFDLVRRLFSKQPLERKNATVVVVEKKRLIEFLDSKRAQNLGICLRFARDTDFDQLIEAVDILDTSPAVVTLDNLAKIKAAIPTKTDREAYEALLEAGHAIAEFRDVEQKVMKLGQRVDLEQKIKVASFNIRFKMMLLEANSLMDVYERANKSVAASPHLAVLMSAILQYGNLVNYGQYTEMQTLGFSVSSAMRLLDFKSSDASITSLHFCLVTAAIRAPDLDFSQMHKGLESVYAAEKITSSGIQEIFEDIRRGLAYVIAYKKQIDEGGDTTPTNTPLVPILDFMINECQEGVAAGVKRQGEINQGVLKTWKFLGEDYKTGYELGGIFEILANVLKGVKRAYNDILANPAKYLAIVDGMDDRQVFTSKFMPKRAKTTF